VKDVYDMHDMRITTCLLSINHNRWYTS